MSYTPTEWESTDVVTATRMNALETAVGEMNMSYTPNTWSDGDILSAEKMNALEQAVASGGGGSSDFSTAEVTVTYTGNDVLTLYIPIYYEVPDLGIIMQGWTNFDEEEPTQTLAIVIPTEGFLIVGGNVPQFTSSNTQVTGNAEVTDGMIKITGDCTITIS